MSYLSPRIEHMIDTQAGFGAVEVDDDLTASEHYHDFCPNAVTLDALLKERSN